MMETLIPVVFIPLFAKSKHMSILYQKCRLLCNNFANKQQSFSDILEDNSEETFEFINSSVNSRKKEREREYETYSENLESRTLSSGSIGPS